MACRTETKTIGEHEYSVTQWPAERAMLMKFRLLKIIGPALAALAGADGDEAKSLEHALSTMFSNATPEEISGLIKECVVGVARDGKRITESAYTEMFSGDDLIYVYQVFGFVVKTNYGKLGNFLQGQLGTGILANLAPS